MKHASVETILMGDVVDCLGDEIDGHEIERSPFGADERHPLRERVTHLLDELERVVRPVDPIRLARIRRPDDHSWAVDAPGHRRLGAHDALGLVLGLVIGMVELLSLVEHRLGEGPFEASGHSDRTDQVDAGGAHVVGELDEVAGSRNVGSLGRAGLSGQVVDGGQVKDVRTAELITVIDREREARRGEIARQGMQPFAAWIEPLALGCEAGPRARADQHEDVVASGEEERDEVATDEPGGPRDEVRHAADNSFLRQSETEPCQSQSSSPSPDPPSDGP